MSLLPLLTLYLNGNNGDICYFSITGSAARELQAGKLVKLLLLLVSYYSTTVLCVITTAIQKWS